jgi:serine O-acetyltransferase
MQNPLSLLFQIKEDLAAHRGEWSRPGFQALAVHRFGNWQRTIKTKAIRAPLNLLAKTAHVFCRNVYGIELPFEAKVGRRVVFEHQHGIVIHGNSTIGDDCVIRQGVTLGCKTVDAHWEAPQLGRGVDVGAGSKILGKVTLGESCTVGANAVISKHVPPNVTVVGHNKVINQGKILDYDIQAASPLPWDAKEIGNWLMGKHRKDQA